ncbi:hypothetical protein DESC_150022 [Desulfosarcina cetonica]|nr:hypothetical protein DESC_150022 [Desulfosarcina cetonica]
MHDRSEYRDRGAFRFNDGITVSHNDLYDYRNGSGRNRDFVRNDYRQSATANDYVLRHADTTAPGAIVHPDMEYRQCRWGVHRPGYR